MTDYGHPITFGLSLYPSVDPLRETQQLAQVATTRTVWSTGGAYARRGEVQEPTGTPRSGGTLPSTLCGGT